MDNMIDNGAGKPHKSESNGPWDNPGGGNGAGKGGSPAPSGSGNQPADGGKKGGNPWEPVSIEGGKAKGKERGPSLEELLRRAGGGGGGGGWGGLPKRADGKSYWPFIVIGLAALWIGFTSIHRIDAAESGVVTQLGKYNRTMGPGIQWTLPAPFEMMEKVNTGESRTITIGAPGTKAENLILTRDRNVIDMAYNVRWQVANPDQFLFQLDNPNDTVSEVAESAMRAAVANFDLTAAIGPGRGEIQADVKKRMQEILNSYRAGIMVQAIDIQESEAPTEVKEAFRAVNAAKQQREGYLNEARKYARQVTERAIGETAEFDKIYEQYRQAPEVTKRRLYYETMEEVLSRTDKTIVEPGNVTPYLPLPELARRSKAAEPAASDVKVQGKK
ncbi:FtsH protease activity modulator HflK [Sphingorhabdus arenilitoris]|uniref:Protein HflK n=1 Tax=Sphingorhabdus arenilitoris TaxID=1490041 RepID=A0ABV8RHS8_9SPHN